MTRATRVAALTTALVVVSCTGADVVLFRVGDGSASEPGGGIGGMGGSIGGAAGKTAAGGKSGASGTRSSGGRSNGGGAGGATSAGGTTDTGGSSGVAGGGGSELDAGPVTNCASLLDCPQTWTCSKSSCSTPGGVCEPRPVLCPGDATPVCGCDHITYWNDCVRRQNGVAASTPGECAAGAASCATTVDCRAFGATCSHVQATGPSCALPGLGTCWVTPLDCTLTPQSPRWVLCQSLPIGSVPVLCVDSCTAIRSGLPYVEAPPGTLCQ